MRLALICDIESALIADATASDPDLPRLRKIPRTSYSSDAPSGCCRGVVSRGAGMRLSAGVLRGTTIDRMNDERGVHDHRVRGQARAGRSTQAAKTPQMPTAWTTSIT